MKKTLTLAVALTAATLSTASFAEADFSCPESPNCVSSQATGDHYIEPLKVSGMSTKEINSTLVNILGNQERVDVVSNKNNVIKAVATSKWFRFKDDITFRINSDETVDIKSSSRTGYSDLGVNRERVEKLRKELKAL
ncbi:DUF1499 domain-containing protein [Endozoicomonas sp. OPT23]|uniref:DUF1499 domain-containing protein n=1 Tax=Endozoicomonas sp. OPT23 TaxID=2072845 RepID=UPI00129B861D|nr:DUF1499 domain-containing protein [Endozoicomonas sp. OPT23]MRI33891.1 DUF1499 domain-containing protein [Endozoicomonas sp. OPT23]